MIREVNVHYAKEFRSLPVHDFRKEAVPFCETPIEIIDKDGNVFTLHIFSDEPLEISGGQS